MCVDVEGQITVEHQHKVLHCRIVRVVVLDRDGRVVAEEHGRDLSVLRWIVIVPGHLHQVIGVDVVHDGRCITSPFRVHHLFEEGAIVSGHQDDEFSAVVPCSRWLVQLTATVHVRGHHREHLQACY